MRLPSAVRRNRWLLLPVACTIAAWSRLLRGGFVWDDYEVFGRWIVGGQNLHDLLFPYKHLAGYYYHPLTGAWQLLQYRLFARNPMGWHFAGISLEVATVVASFFFFRRWFSPRDREVETGIPPEAIAATLFGVWPAAAETVAWLTANSEVLMAFCLLVALNLHLRARDRGHASLLSALFFLGAVLAWEAGVVFLPLAILATVLVPRPAEGPEPASAGASKPHRVYAPELWVPHALAYAAYTALRHQVFHGVGGIGAIARQRLLDPGSYAAAFHAWGWYVREMLLLGGGEPYVQWIPVSPVNDAFAIAGALALLAVVVAGIRLRRWNWLLGPAWILVSIGPPIAVANAPLSVTPVAHRYLFTPQIGFTWLLALAIVGLWRPIAARSRRVQLAVAAAAVAALGVFIGTRLVQATDPWMHDADLWERARRYDPRAALPWANLGAVALDRHDLTTAEDYARVAAWQTKPLGPGDEHGTFSRLAQLYIMERKLDMARLALKQGQKKPTSTPTIAADAVSISALDLLDDGTGHLATKLPLTRLRDVYARLEEAARLDPLNSPARLTLAVLSDSLEEPVLARKWYLEWRRTTLAGSPQFERAGRLAALEEKKIETETDPLKKAYYAAEQAELDERWDEAAKQYEAVLALDADRVEALTALAAIDARHGDYASAATRMQRVVDVAPDSAAHWFNLGYYRELEGNGASCAAAFEKAVGLRPHWAKAMFHWGVCLEHDGDYAGARVQYAKFLSEYDGGMPELRDRVQREIERIDARLQGTTAPEGPRTENVTVPVAGDVNRSAGPVAP